MKRDSFILYTEINDVVKELSDEQKGKLFQAILDYEESGDVPEMDTLIKCAFLPIKRDLDKNDEKWRETSKKRSEAGKKGMFNRYNKSNKSITKDNDVITNDNDVKTEITKVTENEDEHENVNENVKPSLSTKSASAARFSIFWQTYPKRVRQTDAEEEWEKLSVDSELFDRIIKALNVAKESDEWKRENGRFIPHPSNWLKDRRWEDEPVNVRAPAKKNKFANFHQRDRSQEDFDELEKQMLQRRTGHEGKSNQNNKDNESDGDTSARAV